MSEESEEIIEINSEELSENVKEVLQEDLDMNEEFTENKAKKIRLNVKPETTPNKRNIIDSSIAKLYSIFNLVFRSSEGKIKTVDIQNETVYLTILHNDNTFTLSLNKDSKSLANLMDYNNAETLLELQDGKIAVKKTKKSQYHSLIPKNVSISGKIRYTLEFFNPGVLIGENSGDYRFLAFLTTIFLITIAVANRMEEVVVVLSIATLVLILWPVIYKLVTPILNVIRVETYTELLAQTQQD